MITLGSCRSYVNELWWIDQMEKDDQRGGGGWIGRRYITGLTNKYLDKVQ